MRSHKFILALGLLVLGATAAGSALARHGWHGHHSRFSFGLSLGAPLYYPAPYYYAPYYPAPYYYPPYPYGPAPAGADAPAYIERGDSGAPAPAYVEREEGAPPARRRAEGSWYFCAESNGYYPYVKQCPGGWQRVAPRPPAGAER